MAQVFYSEKQTIPYFIRIVIFGAVTVMMGFVALMTWLTEWDTMTNEDKLSMLTLLIGPLLVLVLFVIRMDLRITQTSIDYLIYPFRRKYRTIPFSETTAIELAPLKGMKALRSFGMNRRLNRLEYNFGGNHVLIVTMKTGRQIRFSTFKPRELEYFLRNLPETVPVKGREGVRM
jgi:hypothetical protein